jgi:flagellar biosynthesis protein FlhG
MAEVIGLREIIRQKRYSEGTKNTRIITITSGKGGVGKTNLTVNLAIAFSKLGEKTLVLDGDLGLSNANIVMGIIPSPKYNLSHVIKGEKKLREVIEEGPNGVKLISGASGVMKVADITGLKKKQLIEEIKELGDMVDLIFIDTSAGLSHQVLSFMLVADDIIVITSPEPTAIADAYSIIKAVISKSKEVDIKLVVNRIQSILEGKRVAERLIEICSNFLGIKIENLGYILEDAAVKNAVMQQQPFLLAYPKCKASYCIYHIRDKLANVKQPPKGLVNFIKRLIFKEDEI